MQKTSVNLQKANILYYGRRYEISGYISDHKFKKLWKEISRVIVFLQ